MIVLLLACSQPFDSGSSVHTGVDSGTDTDTASDTGDTVDTSDTSDTAPPEPLPLCINEFMPENVASAHDGTGAALDWIELHNPGDEAIDLTGWTMSDDPTEPDKQALDGLTVGRGEFLLLWAAGDATPGPDHLGFALAAEGGSVGLYNPEGQGTLVTYGSVQPDFSIARVTDCCTDADCLGFQFHGTPGYSNEPVVYETLPLVAPGSVWKYWTGPDVDPAWIAPTFDDSAWLEGPAPLGYGDAQATMIPYGDDPNNKWVTSWFRLGFEVAGADTMDSMTLGIMRDDGAVVYVNGIEVLRDDMPDGEILPTTLASAATTSETGFFSYTLDAFPLVEGHNVVAVEIHQYTATSSDLTMDLQLSGSRIVP